MQRAKIAGFYFNNEKFKKQQSSLIEYHDSLIAFIQELLEMVENWNKENRNMRNKRVDSIQMSLFKHLQASNAMSTEFLQINAESELQLREMQRAFKFSESEREMCWMRIYLSIIGLIVGLVAIIFIIYKGYKYIKK
jgi:F0F1-type ATP synthase membrane subunit a